ncbi:hypothetical protein [Aliidiomarina quisquiliarum]|uniref:hypothetical protein n=1 Tax=Aliidiomarina quisquiliarum TaxID=2938947 RepID=UPI00208F7734|nr:hypothetical protein [Aliidiomarina quisquiliarum]MCO4320973.1 hypothetical protein [Aliidiomarina quisquiliarum]
MKIYKPSEIQIIDSSENIVNNLLNNKKPILKKFNNLINSYSEIKLTSGAENLLIDKLFQELGGKIRFPRVGDNNERFDAFLNFDKYYALAEIEIPSISILDAPRNLLDNYAVAISRRQLADKPIIPLVIFWDIPNKRTDYWNVIYDIKNVLGIEIKTISLSAIALHYWSKTPLDLINDYYLDSDNQKMETAISIFNKNNISAEHGLGYLEPIK